MIRGVLLSLVMGWLWGNATHDVWVAVAVATTGVAAAFIAWLAAWERRNNA